MSRLRSAAPRPSCPANAWTIASRISPRTAGPASGRSPCAIPAPGPGVPESAVGTGGAAQGRARGQRMFLGPAVRPARRAQRRLPGHCAGPAVPGGNRRQAGIQSGRQGSAVMLRLDAAKLRRRDWRAPGQRASGPDVELCPGRTHLLASASGRRHVPPPPVPGSGPGLDRLRREARGGRRLNWRTTAVPHAFVGFCLHAGTRGQPETKGAHQG